MRQTSRLCSACTTFFAAARGIDMPTHAAFLLVAQMYVLKLAHTGTPQLTRLLEAAEKHYCAAQTIEKNRFQSALQHMPLPM